MRLDKFISACAPCSRRDAARLIRSGSVAVNGAVCKSPDVKVNADTDTVTLDSRTLTYQEHVYYMMNKPSGVLSATEDSRCATVLDLVPEVMRRDGLFPAGRLDKDTTGLLILTDDGELAHRMLSPKKHVPKRYAARVDRLPEKGAEERFLQGLVLPDGTRCLPAELHRTGEDTVEVVLQEGRFHQVKRMLSAVGSAVLALHRESIGSLPLDAALAPGELRALSEEEIKRILM